MAESCSMPGEWVPASERANERAARVRSTRGWAGLILLQRRRRIACETEKLGVRLAVLTVEDPDRYYRGDWDEVYDGLLFWNRRDPAVHEQWFERADEVRNWGIALDDPLRREGPIPIDPSRYPQD